MGKLKLNDLFDKDLVNTLDNIQKQVQIVITDIEKLKSLLEEAKKVKSDKVCISDIIVDIEKELKKYLKL